MCADSRGRAVPQTALLCIEFQNEFATPEGKLHDAVKGVMESTGMLDKSVALAETVRAAGGKVMHAAIIFKEDASDNPNRKLGILAGCADGKLFTEGTWNADYCEAMRPKEGDIVVTGKKGLDAFPHSDLEAQLRAAGVETLALCGFLTNCCVESTMRTAFEKVPPPSPPSAARPRPAPVRPCPRQRLQPLPGTGLTAKRA